MNDINTATKIRKHVDDKPEQKLKQARLPFKTTTKRKRDGDTEIANDKVSQAIYIDLTENNEPNSNSEITSNDTINVKSTKVCIIQGEPKTENHSNPTLAVNVADSLPGIKTDNSKSIEKSNPLQKWLKPIKALVTTTNKESTSIVKHQNKAPAEVKIETKPLEAVETNDTERNEPMEVDSENSTPTSSQSVAQESEESNSRDRRFDSSSQNKTGDDKLDVLNDFDVSESEKSFNTGELSAPTTPKSGLALKAKLTPKQKQKREEMELRRLEREKQKQEKEKKRLEEKEEKKKQKEEKEKKRLAEIEAKNEEKRQKEEERKTKEEEKKRLKEEERKQKEEEKRQKEEEKRQKDEEKRQKEEQEKRLKEKTAAAFSSFFLPKNKEQSKDNTDPVDKNSNTAFMPFEVKADMRLASIQRATLSRERLNLLDEVLKSESNLDKDSLYLAQLKSKSYQPGHSENTWPLSVDEDDDDDVVIVDESSSNATSLPTNEKPMRYRCKLLQFHDNRRPAYRGTWRKRSKIVTGRTPFKQEKIFDYEVDSDDEWEDEPGESVDGSDDEKEPEDDYEVDNDLFVPHGYLSDEEAQNDDALDSSPKSNKLKLNVLERQFEEEMKEKTHKLRSRVFGCLWINNSVKKDQGANNVENLLLSFRAIYDEKRAPFVVMSKSDEVTPQSTPSMKVKLKNEFPDSLLPQLVKLAHGSKRNTKVLAKEFSAYVSGEDSTLNLTLSCITKKLKKISTWDSKLACRLVNDEIRNQCDLADLAHTENNWKFITVSEEPATEKSQKTDTEKQPPNNAVSLSSSPSISNQNHKVKQNVSSITKFVKVLTPEEKQMAIEKVVSVAAASPQQKIKPKTGITKFVKVLNSNEKNSKPECAQNKTSCVTSIDLTNDESNESADTAKESATSEHSASTHLASVAPPSECAVKVNDESKSSTIDGQGKSVNILQPKKPRSPTVNILIPRKTPSRPITSPKQLVKSVSVVNEQRPNDMDKSEAEGKPVNVFDFKKPDSVQHYTNGELKSVNTSTESKAKEQSIPTNFSNIFNSKSVNVLIPRKTPNVRNVNEKFKNTASKSPNVPIPKCAQDIQIKETNKNFPSILKQKNVAISNDLKEDTEKTKDVVEDNTSSDFSLCVELADKPEDVNME